MAGTTNRIDLDEAADMIGRARSCVSVVVDGTPRVEPVEARREGDRFLAGAAVDLLASPGVTEAVLVIDEGVYFFDLRAIHVRGRPVPLDSAPDDDRYWFAIEPTKVTCWDYGRLRTADGSH